MLLLRAKANPSGQVVRGSSLARLSGTEAFARALVSAVVPIAALESLGNKRDLSYAYIGGACIALLVTLNLARLERLLTRRRVVAMGMWSLVVAAAIFAVARGPVFALGIGASAAGASVFSVCIALFSMDLIDKRDLAHNESRRIALHGAAWLVGPSLGLWLHGRQEQLPYVASAAAALIALTFFLRLGVGRNRPIASPSAAVVSPLRTVPHYFGQRHLRIAYAITTSRAVFWAAVFVYGPVYVVEAGLPTWVGGAFLSTMSALLLLGPFVARVAQQRGTRLVVVTSFGAIAVGTSTLAIIGDARPIGLAAWAVGALGAAALDVVGNIPFMRTVRPRERVAMTGVFSTWRDVSSLVAPGLAAIALALGSFRLFYLAIAVAAVATAIASTFLPRRI